MVAESFRTKGRKVITYLIICYLFLAAVCFIGQVNGSFNGNLLQQAGLALGVIWCVWRVYLLSVSTWGYPHEPLIATAMGLYALGTVMKTRHYCKRRNRAREFLNLKRQKK